MFNDVKIAFRSKSNRELKKAFVLFKLVENPIVTKFSSFFFAWPFSLRLPLVKTIIRKTVYKQFVGGENTKQCQMVAKNLVQSNVYSILDYSIEGKFLESDFDQTKNEILNLVEIAKDNKEFPFVVFKPTAFGRIDLYEKVGKKETLTIQEEQQWKNIRNRFNAVCQKACNNKVTVMIDAEESWMQDAADDLVLQMMKRYNQKQCIVCNTLQMYRHDRLQYLQQVFQQAEDEDFLIGFKLVRGAYMEKERERAKERNYPSPIQTNKEATDRDYNLALEFIAARTHRISIFAGTHNEFSSQYLTQLIRQNNLSKDLHKIWFGQLYGMSDNISYILANQQYNVAKYLPYGPIEEVMPYLVRRIEENTSVQGQTGRELTLIKQEIQRRKQNQ